MPNNLNLDFIDVKVIKNQAVNHVFVFLEIFECEGGIQSYVKDILDAYINLGNYPRAEVFLLRDSPQVNNPFEGKNIKFHYLKSFHPYWGRLRLPLQLLLCLLIQRPHRVFCGHIKLAPLVRSLCQLLQIPYTILTYGKDVWEPLGNIERSAIQDADQVWTISRYSRDRLCGANHILPEKVQIFPCGVDGKIFTPGDKSSELLEKYDLKNARVLMTVARLWASDIYKGVDITIRALPKIIKEFPEVKYLVIGRGDDQPRLAKLAKDLGVAEQVVFAGFISTENLPAHYRIAEAYIMPSQEGFGIVYLEAMASGIPVLSGDDDGSAEPLQDGKLGWRVPHRNADAVAAACIEILKGNDQRCDGQWLRAQSLSLFSKQALIRRLKSLIVNC